VVSFTSLPVQRCCPMATTTVNGAMVYLGCHAEVLLARSLLDEGVEHLCHGLHRGPDERRRSPYRNRGGLGARRSLIGLRMDVVV
jgi:hypothetical protein